VPSPTPDPEVEVELPQITMLTEPAEGIPPVVETPEALAAVVAGRRGQLFVHLCRGLSRAAGR